MKFNEKLKSLRDNRGMTQEQFSKLLGFSRTTITELENGNKKPSLKTIEKIALKTNTKTSFWLDEEDDINIEAFDGLKIVIKTLKEVGEITEDGKASLKAKKLMLEMLEQELPLYLASLKK